jgi:hypothetical protein
VDIFKFSQLNLPRGRVKRLTSRPVVDPVSNFVCVLLVLLLAGLLINLCYKICFNVKSVKRTGQILVHCVLLLYLSTERKIGCISVNYSLNHEIG